MSTPISQFTGNIKGTDYTVLNKVNFTTSGIVNGYITSGNDSQTPEENCFLDFYVNNAFGGVFKCLRVDNDSVQCFGELSGGDGVFSGTFRSTILQFDAGLNDSSGNTVVKDQQPAIADSDGSEADNARAVNEWLAAARVHGLITT